MILDEAIKHAEEKAKDLEYRQLAEWLAQLNLITELVQEYADKETPEKRCDEEPECWGIEATTLIGKIADILKIDRCEEANNENN